MRELSAEYTFHRSTPCPEKVPLFVPLTLPDTVRFSFFSPIDIAVHL